MQDPHWFQCRFTTLILRKSVVVPGTFPGIPLAYIVLLFIWLSYSSLVMVGCVFNTGWRPVSGAELHCQCCFELDPGRGSGRDSNSRLITRIFYEFGFNVIFCIFSFVSPPSYATPHLKLNLPILWSCLIRRNVYFRWCWCTTWTPCTRTSSATPAPTARMSRWTYRTLGNGSFCFKINKDIFVSL